MIGVAAVLICLTLGAEVPKIDKLSVASSVLRGFEFVCSGITFADKLLGCHFGILDQQIKTGRYRGRTTAAVGA